MFTRKKQINTLGAPQSLAIGARSVGRSQLVDDMMLGAESYASVGFASEQASTGNSLAAEAQAALGLFLSQGKDLYRLIQQAWDERNPELMRPRLTETLFERLSEQMARDDIRDNTEVVALQALLIGRQLGDARQADIEFSGLLRESQRGAATPFREIWSMQRTERGDWLLDDIEVLAV